MTVKERIKELERQLEEAKKEIQAPPLLIIQGKPQSIKYHGNFNKGRQVYENGKLVWVQAIPLIEVEEK